MIRIYRLPFVALALLSLLVGLWTGLSRLGWDIAILSATNHHGAIMIGGFLGTLITLEKIIPLKKRVLYLVPLTSAASVIFFFLTVYTIACTLLLLASAALVIVFLKYLAVNRNRIYLLMVLGALCWLMGNVLLMSTTFYPLALPWWIGFVLLIITAERLELMKFLPVSGPAKTSLMILLFIFIAGALFSFHGFGKILCGGALVGTALWLLRFDLIGITIQKKGLTQFIAIALLCGYIALLLTGVLFMTLPDTWTSYDALVHTYFIGFVFAMIFAHGPVILPGVLGVSIKPFHPILFFWLIVLQVSWSMRFLTDILFLMEWRKISGVLSAASILGYFVTLALLILTSLRHAKTN
jgi:hypothetical protein